MRNPIYSSRFLHLAATPKSQGRGAMSSKPHVLEEHLFQFPDPEGFHVFQKKLVGPLRNSFVKVYNHRSYSSSGEINMLRCIKAKQTYISPK